MVKLKRKNNKNLGKILGFYKRHLKYYVGYCIVLVLKGVKSFFSAMFLANIISCLMAGNLREGLMNAVYILALHIFSEILSLINVYLFKNLESKVRFDIQQKVIQSALNIRMDVYDEIGSGVIVNRLTSDIDHISERFKSLTTLIVDMLRRVAYLVYLFLLDWRIAVFTLGCVIVLSVVNEIRIHYLHKLKPAVKAQKEVVSSRIIEVVRGVKDIKTLNCEDNTLKLLGKEQNEFIKRDKHEWYVGNSISVAIDFTSAVLEFSFIILSIILMANYNLTATVFYTCYLYKDHTLSFATNMREFKYKLSECEVYAERLSRLLYPPKDMIDMYGDDKLNEFSGQIEFKDVCFSYGNGIPVLENLSFKIMPRQTVALVGESGCGKTTITSLIAHLYYKNSGDISFDGTSIDNLDKEFIKENVAVINQFPYIFNISIRDNFKMIRSDITDEEICSLCDELLLTDLVKSLPKGLDSIIGEGGCQLSGGQRQKLCIARALARKTKVLILDEATSSLDNASQTEIMQVIEKLKSRLTIIIIAHRLSTITYADSILLIKNGQLVAQGKHNELLEENDYYKELYYKQ